MLPGWAASHAHSARLQHAVQLRRAGCEGGGKEACGKYQQPAQSLPWFPLSQAGYAECWPGPTQTHGHAWMSVQSWCMQCISREHNSACPFKHANPITYPWLGHATKMSTQVVSARSGNRVPVSIVVKAWTGLCMHVQNYLLDPKGLLSLVAMSLLGLCCIAVQEVCKCTHLTIDKPELMLPNW